MSTYVGTELELFAKAVNWKRYMAATLRPYITGRVLEVGAGLGGNIPFFKNTKVESWTALEPDSAMCQEIQTRFSNEVTLHNGDIRSLPAGLEFDAILYIDVLEHIKDDLNELAGAAQRLRKNGALVILAPAHQFLFSPFDQHIGHFRRYTTAMLRALRPAPCAVTCAGYLDSAGFFLSLGNRMLLSQSIPTQKQIAFWDTRIIPISRKLDKILYHRFGKSAFIVFQKT